MSSNPCHIAINPNRNIDLSTQNHTTCQISQGHSLYQVWTLRDHSFLSYALFISVKMHLLTLWPWPFNPKTKSLLQYPKVIHYATFEHFGYGMV